MLKALQVDPFSTCRLCHGGDLKICVVYSGPAEKSTGSGTKPPTASDEVTKSKPLPRHMPATQTRTTGTPVVPGQPTTESQGIHYSYSDEHNHGACLFLHSGDVHAFQKTVETPPHSFDVPVRSLPSKFRHMNV